MEPVLVIMAAGMGSRYGGLKQMDPMDEYGNVIIDYSMYDAKRAGFKKVVFITKSADVKEFKEIIGTHAEKNFEVAYALQELDDIPDGCTVPEGRAKPWGTAHALYSARNVIDGPFAAINADDYYGIEAFQDLYKFLKEQGGNKDNHYAMIGYELKNTVSESGHVARGLCQTEGNKLVSIRELTRIEKRDGGIAYSEDDGASWTSLDVNSPVSMNMWAFTVGMNDYIKEEMERFFKEEMPANPLKCECFVPMLVGSLLESGKCNVEVIPSKSKWYGVTYKEDKALVCEALKSFREQGLYPGIENR